MLASQVALLFLAHLWGDFMLQTGWMANNKHRSGLEGWWPTSIHALVYTACYAIALDELTATDLLIIGGTHAVIDHYRLAAWWAKLVNGDFREPPTTPRWCITAIDQTLHLTLNALVLYYRSTHGF